MVAKTRYELRISNELTSPHGELPSGGPTGIHTSHRPSWARYRWSMLCATRCGRDVAFAGWLMRVRPERYRATAPSRLRYRRARAHQVT